MFLTDALEPGRHVHRLIQAVQAWHGGGALSAAVRMIVVARHLVEDDETARIVLAGQLLDAARALDGDVLDAPRWRH